MPNDMPTDPWREFQNWFAEAQKTSLRDPNALVLSTVDEDGNPHSRVVLCKEIRPEGLVFHTNYLSEKGKELSAHPQCAINFFWDTLHRQVRMNGTVKQLPAAESDAYWKSRSRDSQLTQFASKQSEGLASREQMLEEIKKAEREFQGKDVPRPRHWGGYLFSPEYIELWIGQKDRFHDRFLYTKVQSAWKAQRLYP
jgi:pyridoxamine 5'-phosphate oxidase